MHLPGNIEKGSHSTRCPRLPQPDQSARLFRQQHLFPTSTWSPEQIKETVHEEPSSSSSTQLLLIIEHVCRPITFHLFSIGPRPAATIKGWTMAVASRRSTSIAAWWEREGHQTCQRRRTTPSAMAPHPKDAGESRVRCQFCSVHQKTSCTSTGHDLATSFAKTFFPPCLSNWILSRNDWTITRLFCLQGKGGNGTHNSVTRGNRTPDTISRNCTLQRLAWVLLPGAARQRHGCLVSSRWRSSTVWRGRKSPGASSSMCSCLRTCYHFSPRPPFQISLWGEDQWRAPRLLM